MMENQEFELVLEEALNERDAKLQEKVLPEINIAEAIPVIEGLEFGVETEDYGVTSVIGSVKDGIIGNKTNSLVTIDSEIEWRKANVGSWGKAAVWTLQELEKIAKLGITLDSKKQDDLYANALATIQYAGYVGHEGVAGQVGLLNSGDVEVVKDASGKTLKEMTSTEAVEMILNVYNKAWEKSDYRIQPTHIAIDAIDFMTLVQKFEVESTVVGTDMLPIGAMDRIMAALRKASNDSTFSVNFVKVPSRYAQGITKGFNRLACYVYDEQYVAMKVHMPELLPTRQRDLLTFECGYRASFTGALWKEPDSATYLDYKA